MAQDFAVEIVDNPLIRFVADMLIKFGFNHPRCLILTEDEETSFAEHRFVRKKGVFF
jgi:hypothetical protein